MRHTFVRSILASLTNTVLLWIVSHHQAPFTHTALGILASLNQGIHRSSLVAFPVGDSITKAKDVMHIEFKEHDR
jgi:hypothetical protein